MKFRTTLLVTLLALTPSAFARDAHYDGSDPLLCTVMTGEICDIRGCEHADRQDDLGGIKHLVVDFKRDRIKSPQGGVSATIKQQSQVDNRLFLQGLSEREDADEDDARSWTMTIADPTGTMTLTVAGEEIALVMFGSCAPIE